MIDNAKVFSQNAIKLTGSKTFYFDPYNIPADFNDADLIFITHSHYDHFSPDDIKKVRKDDTKIVITNDIIDQVHDELGFDKDNTLIVLPNADYSIDGIKFRTIPAYNKIKPFHPRRNSWVGYIIDFDNTTYYIAGDTDYSFESNGVECDVCFVPVGGKYTMDYIEASKLVNTIKPKLAIPTHYGTIVGTPQDGKNFSDLVDKDIECQILLTF